MFQRFPRTFWYFLIGLLALNLLQAAFTELIYDEAYYWHFAQQLDWGYFDHPPMVAFLIWLGQLFFDGELGVRFVGCLMGAGTIVLLWMLIEDAQKKQYVPHFFLLLFAMALFNAYGFFTLPDTPLLFFTALFLWVYRRFLRASGYGVAVVLGVVMAALLYSKYHAVLVILFVLFSNVSLVKNKFAWVAVLVGVACYAPHLWWLYENQFAPILYHLSERPNHAYDFAGFTLGYLLNLIVNFGLLFPWVYWALLKTKPKDTFEKALSYLAYGVILFFFISSFQRRTQAQWVVVICIPMAILAYQYLLAHQKSRKWMFGISLVSMVILLYARLGLIFDPLSPVAYETHGNKAWVADLKATIGDTPAVFENSYRRAPMYAFYSGNTSYCFGDIRYRKNQYSIDRTEQKVQQRRIAFIGKYATSGDFSYRQSATTTFYGRFIDDFESFRKLECHVDQTPVDIMTEKLQVKVYNPYEEDIPLDKIAMHIAFLNRYKELMATLPFPFDAISENGFLKARDTTYLIGNLPKFDGEGAAHIKFSIAENGLEGGINSKSFKIKR